MKNFVIERKEVLIAISMNRVVEIRMNVFVNQYCFVIELHHYTNGSWRMYIKDKNKLHNYIAMFNSSRYDNDTRLEWFGCDMINNYDKSSNAICFFPYSDRYYKQKYVQCFRTNFLPILQDMRHMAVMTLGI